jgi:phosphoserine phosphatase
MPDQLKRVEAKDIVDRLFREAPADALFVFDCDGTLINGDVAFHTAWGLVREGLADKKILPMGHEASHGSLDLDYDGFEKICKAIQAVGGHNALYEWEALIQAGHSPKAIVGVAERMIDHGIKVGSLHYTKPVADIAFRSRDRAWIVSGSPQACVTAVGTRLGIPPERTLGTMLEVKDGVFQNKILPPGIIWEALKRLALEQNGIYKPWFVAGDSIGDWNMMEMSVGWRWCIVWDKHRHRGEEFRQIVQERVLGAKAVLPEEPGIYLFQDSGKNWVLEVKAPSA